VFEAALVLSEPAVVVVALAVVGESCGGVAVGVVPHRRALFDSGLVRDGGDVAVDVRVRPGVDPGGAFRDHRAAGQADLTFGGREVEPVGDVRGVAVAAVGVHLHLGVLAGRSVMV